MSEKQILAMVLEAMKNGKVFLTKEGQMQLKVLKAV